MGTKGHGGTVAKEPFLGAVCGWYKVWDGVAVAFRLVFVWKGRLLVLLTEWVSAILSGNRAGLDKAMTVVVSVFSINVWSLHLFERLQTIGLFWDWFRRTMNGLYKGIFLSVLLFVKMAMLQGSRVEGDGKLHQGSSLQMQTFQICFWSLYLSEMIENILFEHAIVSDVRAEIVGIGVSVTSRGDVHSVVSAWLCFWSENRSWFMFEIENQQWCFVVIFER